MPRCKMCGAETARPRKVYATPADATGASIPGARVQVWTVCEECASLLDDDDEEQEPE